MFVFQRLLDENGTNPFRPPPEPFAGVPIDMALQAVIEP
jgi:hypothetical protein